MKDIRVEVKGFDVLRHKLKNIGKQARFAGTKAVNAVAKELVKDERAEIGRVFHAPRPVTQRAVVVKQYANYRNPEIVAVVAVDDGTRRTAAESAFDARSLGQGKNAVMPNKYLRAQIFGGARVAKRYEVALQRAGLMPSGMVAVFAKRSGYLDSHGNLPGPKIVQILSWFKAFPEQGYRANMKDKTRKNLTEGKRKGMKWGFAYFRGGRKTGLADGIWERHYPNGQVGKSFIKPVLIYVSGADYRQRFDFFGIGEKVVAREWQKQLNAAWDNAVRTAK